MMVLILLVGNSKQMEFQFSHHCKTLCLSSQVKKLLCMEQGRTDAGVHAYGQVASFAISKKISTDVIRDGLNQHLRPLMISVLKQRK